MSSSPNKNQSSGLVKGFIALLGLAVLGGGAYTLYTVIKNQNNPVINVQGSQATAKSGDNNVTLVNSSQNASTKDNPSANQVSPSPTATPTSASAKIVDTSLENKWVLKFPLYRMDKDKCNLVGVNSVSLVSSRGGAIWYQGAINIYGYDTTIQGAVTSSGKVNLSLSSDRGKFIVTFESANASVDTGETVITGSTTALNCPDSKFELRKQG